MLRTILSFTDWLWGYPMLVLLGGGGLLMTILLKGFQFIHLPYILNHTIIKAFAKKGKDADKISGFQALTTALSTTLGTGNIVGVALAVAYGGPGAVFWMWIIGLVAAIIKYSEVVTALRYRFKNEKGEWTGGPMVYIPKITGLKWIGTLFSIVVVFDLALANTVQLSSVSDTLLVHGIPKLATVIVITIFVATVVYGGLKRIVYVTERMIPFMSILYMAFGLVIILMHVEALPGIILAIFKNAFTSTAVTGGFAGATVALTIRWGIARGIYSNDSGNGLTSIAHSNADVKHPVQQGLWGVFEVFFDTIIVCSVTALVVLASDVWRTMPASMGGSMTVTAFKQNLGQIGGLVVSISLILFALSTVIVFVYYAEKAAEVLWGPVGSKITRFCYIAILLVSGFTSLGVLIQLLDFSNAVIIILNMIAIFKAFPYVRLLTKDYMDNQEKYEDLKADSNVPVELYIDNKG